MEGSGFGAQVIPSEGPNNVGPPLGDCSCGCGPIDATALLRTWVQVSGDEQSQKLSAADLSCPLGKRGYCSGD